ncbi:MAG: methyltransferase [Chloroflexota bacterium]
MTATMDSDASAAPWLTMRRLVDGFQVSQAVHAVVALGIPDLLADGPRAVEHLAAHVGAHAPSLVRVLRALASVGVLRADPENHFALTDTGACLCTNAPERVGGWARFVGRPYHWQAWSSLLHTVRTGETAFVHVHGRSGWDFRATDAVESDIFDHAMTDLSRRASRALLQSYDFSAFNTIVDVGGGRGALLAAILTAHPSARGILLDLPHVVRDADAVLRERDVAQRCAVVGANFFETIPPGGDLYILKSVLHDWPDKDAANILRTCRAAMPVGARLIIVERVMDALSPSRDTAFSDLEMLVGNGGCERTMDQYADLLAGAWLRLERVTSTSSGMSILEAGPLPIDIMVPHTGSRDMDLGVR